jgi:hypothetical protein
MKKDMMIAMLVFAIFAIGYLGYLNYTYIPKYPNLQHSSNHGQESYILYTGDDIFMGGGNLTISGELKIKEY